ncbi:hypothetical protein GQ53DRAFT_750725 [Thozetella sp. PMI_491]|nr:hypothetical protein GQ53DRAFT_750725 [Thozetella sp. PMI_491]
MDISAQLIPVLTGQSLPIPSRAWLNGIIANRNPPPPVNSLVATARIRLLAADLTTPGLLDSAYIAGHSFPTNLANPETQQTRLGRDVVVQVLDIEDISRSRWEQVEDLEAIERGEQTRGREIIRLPAGGEEESGEVERGDEAATQVLGQTQTQSGGASRQRDRAEAVRKNATHKLVLQDCKGQKVFALELKRVESIAIGKTNIGEKMLLRSWTTVSRGMVLLDPAICVSLGGKVEAWQKSWVEGRLARLREAAAAGRPEEG